MGNKFQAFVVVSIWIVVFWVDAGIMEESAPIIGG